MTSEGLVIDVRTDGVSGVTQLFDGEAAAQGFCTATTRDQAGLLFRELRRMIKAAPALSAFMDTGNKHLISTAITNGTIRTLSRDGNSADGIRRQPRHRAARRRRLPDRRRGRGVVPDQLRGLGRRVRRRCAGG
ncbi:phage terminase [Rhodovulum visakhapatnamense]|uniref:Phage terminase n=1 Tax=Rhodovulum visakhapatnamense TaxID=364297 RepID=A0A4R8G8T8_9RHOB|nr:phage terminase [Rhodovulum visakhapatnamense]